MFSFLLPLIPTSAIVAELDIDGWLLGPEFATILVGLFTAIVDALVAGVLGL